MDLILPQNTTGFPGQIPEISAQNSQFSPFMEYTYELASRLQPIVNKGFNLLSSAYEAGFLLLSGVVFDREEAELNSAFIRLTKRATELKNEVYNLLKKRMVELLALIEDFKGLSPWSQKAKAYKTRNVVHVELEELKKRLGSLSRVEKPKDPGQNRLVHLENVAPGNMSAELLAHIIGEPFAAETGYEGFSPITIMKEIDLFIESQLAKDPTNAALNAALSKLSKILKRSLKFNKNLGSLAMRLCALEMGTGKVCHTSYDADVLKHLQSTFKNELKSLKAGEALFIPGGWNGNGSDSGHSIVYEVIKQLDGRFTFRITNRGSGAENHPRFKKNGQTQVIPFIERKNIEFEKLTDQVAILAIVEPNTKLGLEDSPWNAQLFYKGLFSDEILGGELTTESMNQEDWGDLQRSGVCAYVSLDRAIQNHIPLKDYYRFRIEMGFHALQKFIASDIKEGIQKREDEDIKSLIGDSSVKYPKEQQYRLLDKAIYTYSIDLNRYLNEFNDLLSERELSYLTDKLFEMKNSVLDFKKKTLKERIEAADLDLKVSKTLLMGGGRELMPTAIGDFTYSELKLKSAEATALDVSVFKMPLQNWEPSEDKLNHDLSLILDDLNQLMDQKQYRGILSYFDEIAEKFAQIKIESLSLEDREEVTLKLVSFYESIYKASNIVAEGRQVFPRRFLSTLRLNKLIYDLCSKEVAEKLHLPYPFQFLFSNLYALDTNYFTIDDPAISAEIYKIKDEIIAKAPIPRIEPGETSSLKTALIEKTSIHHGESFLRSFIVPSILHFVSIQRKKDLHLDDIKDIKTMVIDFLEKKKEGLPSVWRPLIDHVLYSYSATNYFMGDYQSNHETVKSSIHLLPRSSKEDSPGLTRLAGLTENLKVHYSTTQLANFITYESTRNTIFENTHYEIRDLKIADTLNNHFKPDRCFSEWSKSPHFEARVTPEEEMSEFNLGKSECLFSDLVHMKLKHWEDRFRNYVSANGITTPLEDSKDREEILELRLIVAEDSLRVQRAIAFFSNPVYRENLSKLDYQTFLEIVLFNGNVLSKELVDPVNGPQLIDQLSLFFKQAYERALLQEDWSTATFILKMNHKVNQFAVFHNAFKAEDASPFLNSVQELQKLVELPEIRGVEKKQAQAQLLIAIANKKNLSSEDVPQILELLFSIRPINEGYQNFKDIKAPLTLRDREAIQNIFIKHARFFENYVQSNPQIIEEILAQLNLTQDLNKGHWRPSKLGKAYFENEEKNLTVNILDGSIVDNDGTFEWKQLPDFVLNHPTYQSLYQGEPRLSKFIGEKTFQFKDKLGSEIKVQLDESMKMILQKTFEGQTYSYLPADEIYLEESKSSKVGNLNFIADYSSWIKRGDNDDYQILVFERQTGALYARINSSIEGRGVYFKREETQDYLVNPPPSLAEIVFGFEDEQHVNVFASEDKDVVSIEFPRLVLENQTPLTFKRVGDRMQLVSDPSLFLSTKKNILHVVPNNALFLENIEGEPLKVLFSPFFHTAKGKSSFNLHEGIDYQLQDLNSKFNLIEYDLEKGTDPQQPYLIKAKTPYKKIYRIYTLIKQQQYKEAIALTCDVKSNFSSFGKKETEVLSQIYQSQRDLRDYDPRATAFRMHLIALVYDCAARNKMQLPKGFFENLDGVYNRYLNNLDYLKGEKLGPFDELLIASTNYHFNDRKIKLLNDLGIFGYVPERPAQVEFPYLDNIVQNEQVMETTTNSLVDAFVPSKTYAQSQESLLLNPHATLKNDHFLNVYKLIKEDQYKDGHTFDIQKFLFVSKHGSQDSDIQALNDLLIYVSKYPAFFPPYEQMAEELRKYESCLKVLDCNEKEVSKFRNIVKQLSSGIRAARSRMGMSDLEKMNTKSRAKLPSIRKKSSSQGQRNTPLDIELPTPSVSLMKEHEMHQKLKELFFIKYENSISNPGAIRSQLQPALQQESSEPLEIKCFEAIQKDVDFYLDHDQKLSFIMPEEASFKIWAQNIQNEIEQSEMYISKLKSSILTLANKKSESSVGHFLSNTQRLFDEKSSITIEELLLIFMKENFRHYAAENPNLNFNDIKDLHYDLKMYLVHATYQQHLKRMFKIAQKTLASSGEDQKEWASKLLKFGSVERNYDIDVHPEYLVFEYFSDIRLFPQQVEKLGLLKQAVQKENKPGELGLIVEAIMGFGKSKVILPILSVYLADGKNLPIIVMPNSLLESLGEDIKETLSPFKKQIKHIRFDRASKTNGKSLEQLYISMLEAKEKLQTVVFSSSDLQSFYLKYIETLKRSVDGIQASEVEIPHFKKIFKLLKENGLPVFDEADLLFNCRRETHFTLSESKPISDDHIQLSAWIYDLINRDKSLEAFNFEFKGSVEGGKVPSEKQYHEEFKPILVDKLIEVISKPGFSTDNLIIQRYKNEFLKLDPAALRSYLLGHADAQEELVFEKLVSPTAKNLIALIQAQLNIFLPLTLDKKIFEHYGPPDREHEYLAIPYHHGKAVSGSEFGNQYEVINYTLQYYLKYGISSEIIKDRLIKLKAEFIDLVEKYPQHDFRQFQPYRELQALAPGKTTFKFTDEELQEITEKVNSSAEFKLSTIAQLILPKVKIYKQRLSTNPQIFGQLFNKVIGFTGTLWNEETYPTHLKSVPSQDIIGKTLTQFMSKSDEKIITLKSYDLAREKLQSLVSGMHAFIDLDGLYDQWNRLSVCRDILAIKKEEGIEGVIFYDHENQLKIITHPDQAPIALSESPLKSQPEKTFTFYDHQRTTGADVNQALTARARMSVGRHTILRDLAQAAWRMRGLAEKQAVDFVVTEQDKKLMQQALNQSVDHDLTLSELIAYSIKNQMNKKSRDNLLSQKQKIHAILEKAITKKLLDPSCTTQNTLNIFNEAQEIFITSVEDLPYEQYNKLQRTTESEQVLKEYIQKLKIKFSNLFSKSDWMAIEEEMHQEIKIEHLKKVTLHAPSHKTHELEQEVSVLQEVEQRQEIEMNQEVKVEKSEKYCKFDPVKWDTFFELHPSSEPLDMSVILPRLDEKFVCLFPKALLTDFEIKKHQEDEEYIKREIEKGVEGMKDYLREHYNSALRRSYQMRIQVARLNDYLGDKVSKFSPNIHVSSNLMPVFRGEMVVQADTPENLNLFGSCQNPCQEILCLQTDKGPQLVMLDYYDAFIWKNKIHQANQQKGEQQRLTKDLAFIINIHNGELEIPAHYGKEKVKQFMQQDDFKELLLQTKLLSGSLKFSIDEIEQIDQWMKRVGLSKPDLKNFMALEVFSSRGNSAQYFASSLIGKFLDSKLELTQV